MGRVPSSNPRCAAKSKQTGEQCRLTAIAGGTVCRYHGGAAPLVKAAAARRLERARLDGEVGKLLAELEETYDHPIEGLLVAQHQAVAMVTVLRFMIEGLGVPGVGVGDQWTSGNLYGPNHLGDGAPHVLVTMYGEWLDRAARITKVALDAGVDERRVQLAEDQAQQVADVLQGAMVALLTLVSDRIPEAAAHRDELMAAVPALILREIDRVHPSGAGPPVDASSREVDT